VSAEVGQAVDAPPLVSIGVPLHNGERYLREALDSLLAQDYSNLEVVISDNASSDATQRICEEYAARDCRVAYHRVDQNMGAIWNFNHVFELTRGEYFMWAAYDDLRAPRFVSACVDALKERPEAVMCCTLIDFIDEEGRPLQTGLVAYAGGPTGKSRIERVREIAHGEAWFGVYGLARRSVLETVRRATPTWGFDVVLLLEMCLLGPVRVLPDRLFSYRLFEAKTQQDVAKDLSISSEGGSVPPCWSCLTLELLRSIWGFRLGPVEKVRLSAALMWRFCLTNVPVAAGIRQDLARTLRAAWRGRRWRAVVVLLLMGALVYPFHNRFSRSLYRLGRQVGGRA
jgi:glycosyltransferase involved in cell wall biosynthesis